MEAVKGEGRLVAAIRESIEHQGVKLISEIDYDIVEKAIIGEVMSIALIGADVGVKHALGE
jgi:hypothetical protein